MNMNERDLKNHGIRCICEYISKLIDTKI